MIKAIMWTAGFKYSFIDDGDDCCIIADKSNLTSKLQRFIQDRFEKMGFVMKCEELVYKLENISFCQSNPINLGNEVIMVREIKNSIAKDCVSLIKLTDETTYFRFMAAVGMGGLSLTGGVPVLQSFYNCLIRNSQGYKPFIQEQLSNAGSEGILWWSQYGNRTYTSVTDIARHSYYQATGIKPDEQIALENYYDDFVLTYIPTKFEHYNEILNMIIGFYN